MGYVWPWTIICCHCLGNSSNPEYMLGTLGEVFILLLFCLKKKKKQCLGLSGKDLNSVVLRQSPHLHLPVFPDSSLIPVYSQDGKPQL